MHARSDIATLDLRAWTWFLDLVHQKHRRDERGDRLVELSEDVYRELRSQVPVAHLNNTSFVSALEISW